MAAFLVPADIGNRALQHCGQPSMDPTLGFNDGSVRAGVISSCYDKLRRAELRRNVWAFATRRAALRAIDSNSLLVAPALWVQSTTYFAGSIVSDAYGTAWISRVRNNFGNQPGVPSTAFAWEPYFGPLTVSLYDSSQGYFSGELVYTAAGDGTANTYLSLISGNAVHPAVRNQWSVNTTYFQNQVVQRFPAWASGTTYSQGQGIRYTDGNVYVSLTNSNVGHTPSTSTASWALMPTLSLTSVTVPTTTSSTPPSSSPINEWAEQTTYSSSFFVMFNGRTYLSLVNSNTGNFPNAAASTSWVAVTNGTEYMSLIDLNNGNDPANSPALWAIGTTYALNAQVYDSATNLIYTSLAGGNLGNQPSASPLSWSTAGVLCPWTTTFTLGGGNQQWLQVGGSAFPSGVGLTFVDIRKFPINSGPVSDRSTLNVYRLPAGFLRICSQNPKAGSMSYLGTPSNDFYDDWLYEGNYIVTRESQPLIYRFVADVTDVSAMDDMFCEGLGCRIGEEVCEPLTNSMAKMQAISNAYKDFMGQARTVNGIEIGSEESPLDDWIACRA